MSDQASPDTLDSVLSTVRLKLLDPLGRAISELPYEIREGGRVVAQGVTDAEGRMAQFASKVGTPLAVHVQHFVSDGMKQIREITPWCESFAVKLVSGKVKERTTMTPDAGDPGAYRRKTYKVKAGDTLGAIARANGTTPAEIARLNGLSVSATIFPGQSLKLPVAAPPAGPAPQSVPAPQEPTQAGPASTAANGPPPAPYPTQPPRHVPVPVAPAPPAVPVSDRGENGTPKTTVNASCSGTACIKLGDTGPLIEELNLRLTGFGGTVLSPRPLNEFTTRTQAAVMQFQRDYMGVAETGKVCSALLHALDDFRTRYPISLAAMLCRCGHCQGFGTHQEDSRAAGIFKDGGRTVPYPGIEYPGMHRAILWSFRAALFYTASKDAALGYRFFRISSGYRCWHKNAVDHLRTTNHMGNALDVQFRKGNSATRCSGADVDEIRKKIFVDRMGAQLSWPLRNKLSLETAAQGATSWVHMDVREYAAQYKDSRYYAVTQAHADGDSMLEIARRDGRLPLLACGGIAAGPAVAASSSTGTSQPAGAPTRAPAPRPDPAASGHFHPTPTSTTSPVPSSAGPQSAGERRAVASLAISERGLAFIRGWEKCKLQPYDDSRHFCTVGWGHLIAEQSCASLAGDSRLAPYKDGIDQAAADRILALDVRSHEAIVKSRVQVPLLQQEYDALVSLVFNMGGLSKCPRLVSKLNTKDYAGCCDEFADITNHGTPGLVARRRAEMNMFRNGVYDSTH